MTKLNPSLREIPYQNKKYVPGVGVFVNGDAIRTFQVNDGIGLFIPFTL